MAVRSRFTPRVPQAPTGRKLSVQTVKDMRGLNSTDPYGILEPSASPYLRNARMYLSDTRRQVSISTRQGATFYSTPVGEATVDTEVSTSGADEEIISAVRWVAQKFTPSTAGVLTKVEVNARTSSGTSPVLIQIFNDDSGEPGDLLATSTILNADISTSASYVTARFVEAPTIATSTDYWIVFSVQEADSDTYLITTTNNTTDGLVSEDAGENYTALNASINYRAYGSENSGVIGATRFYPSSNSPTTFFAHKTSLYSVDDGDGSTTEQKSGLNANSEKVRFAQFDDAIFAANGYDDLQRSTGTTFADVTQLTTTPSNVISHKNRLWVVSATDPNRLEFCELADYDNWESTAFIYVPEPKSSDPITGLVSFQDTLVVFTANNKFVIYGDDLATFEVRQSLGKKGAVSQEAIVFDENYVYFVASDGHLYRWNGSKDEQLSRVIEADIDDIADIENVRLTLWEDRVYVWFQNTGQTTYNRNFVYETRYNEWFYDTGRHINGGVVLDQEDDAILFTSDRAGVLYRGGINYSDLGKPIEFEYHTNYFDFGSPDNLKQVRRLYLQFRKTSWKGSITVGADVDFQDNPVEESVDVQTSGYEWGDGLINWGDPEIFWGSQDQYLRHRMTVPGQATHYQIRVRKTGTETPLYFIGHSEHYRSRRAA